MGGKKKRKLNHDTIPSVFSFAKPPTKKENFTKGKRPEKPENR